MTPELAIGLGVVAALAGFTQGAAGFGFGMVVMAVFPLALGVKSAVLHVALLAIVLNAKLAWTYRRGVDLRSLLPLAPGALIGAPLGVLLLRASPPLVLRLTLGLILVAYSLHGLRTHGRAQTVAETDAPSEAPPPPRRRIGDGVGVVAGLAAGVLGGAFNTGGPPVVLYCHARGFEPVRFKGVLQAFFLAGGLAQVTSFVIGGDLDSSVGLGAAVLAPLMLLGSWVGVRWSGRIDAERFRRGVLWLLLALGVTFLWKAVAELI